MRKDGQNDGLCRPCSVLPAHPVRSTHCDGRSPGSRIVALSCLPGTLASGVLGLCYRLQLRGQPRSGPSRASPYSLFTPDLSIRGTIAGDPIVTAAAWQWRFVSGTCGGAPLLWRNVAGAPRVAVAVLVAALEQGNQRFDDHAACPLQLGNGSGRSRHSCGAKTGSSTRQASSSARIRLSSIGSQPMKTSSWRRSPHIGSK